MICFIVTHCTNLASALSRAVVAVRPFFCLNDRRKAETGLARSLGDGDGGGDDERRTDLSEVTCSALHECLHPSSREREEAASPSPVHPFRPSFPTMPRYSARMFGHICRCEQTHSHRWTWSCCAKVKPRQDNSASYPSSFVLRIPESRESRLARSFGQIIRTKRATDADGVDVIWRDKRGLYSRPDGESD